MAELWKIEYHVIGEDGQAMEWCDSLETAMQYLDDGAVSIEKVRYYHDDRKTVWTKDGGFVEDDDG